MRAIQHNFAEGDIVVYQQPYRAGWFVGEIQSIGKMYATIDDARIHIPKVAAKLKDGKQGAMLAQLLKAADTVYTRAMQAAADARKKSRKGLFDHYCEGNFSE